MLDERIRLNTKIGGTNYKNKLLFVGQGKGENIPPAIYLMNPEPPYDTKGRLGSLRASSTYHVLMSGGYLVMLNNYFGRQFNSINDASVNPRNGDIYFTDPTYGFVQDFRPAPGFPKQVWRFNEATGAVTVVADGFSMPNGIQFSPSGSHLYVTDSGVAQAFRGMEYNNPSTMLVDLCCFVHSPLIQLVTDLMSPGMGPCPTDKPLRLSHLVYQMGSMWIQRAMSTWAVQMACKFIVHQGS